MAAITNIGLFFSMKQIVNNRLNPVYLAVATSGYRIQSQTLHIPDRFGFFASSPPRLQVEEGAAFAHMVFMICYAIMTWCFVASLASPNARLFALAMVFVAMEIGIISFVWYMMCTKASRQPNYVWKDWDEKKE